MVSDAVSIPVIAHGGCGSPADCVDIIQNANVDAITIASVFHYNYIMKVKHTDLYEDEGNTSFLSSGKTFGKINPCSIEDVKNAMKLAGISVRF